MRLIDFLVKTMFFFSNFQNILIPLSKNFTMSNIKDKMFRLKFTYLPLQNLNHSWELNFFIIFDNFIGENNGNSWIISPVIMFLVLNIFKIHLNIFLFTLCVVFLRHLIGVCARVFEFRILKVKIFNQLSFCFLNEFLSCLLVFLFFLNKLESYGIEYQYLSCVSFFDVMLYGYFSTSQLCICVYVFDICI